MNPALKIQEILTFEIFLWFTLDLSQDCPFHTTVTLILQHIYCLHLMNSDLAWVLVSSGTQIQPQMILDPDYLPDYLSVSYDYTF